GVPLAQEGGAAVEAAAEAGAFSVIFLVATVLLLASWIMLALMPEKTLRGVPETPVIAD
ncbi:MFS transporter, partial [Escherichia coli]|nr:MFS transporter [Escherichia coli]